MIVLTKMMMDDGVPADTAARVEEPVHEDSSAVVVWIVSKQTVPLVLLKSVPSQLQLDDDGDGCGHGPGDGDDNGDCAMCTHNLFFIFLIFKKT